MRCLKSSALAEQCRILGDRTADQRVPSEISEHDTHVGDGVGADVVACQDVDALEGDRADSNEAGNSGEVGVVAAEPRSREPGCQSRGAILGT